MKKNMGPTDRIIRILLAIVIGILYYMEIISGTAALILGILAVVFLLTSIVQVCPLYMPFGIKTCKTEESE